MGLLKKILKRIRRSQNAKQHRRRLELEWTLPSGITVQVEDYGEWLIYNDIFVDGEYDRPIKNSLQTTSSKDCVTIVDIGANVGFFTMRVADWLLRNTSRTQKFQIFCIEGSPTVFKKLQARVRRDNLLMNHVNLTHGLVGRSDGEGMIVEKPFHAMNRVDILAKSKEKGVLVSYINLPEKLAEIPEIDLLKCDIEGSELDFLESSQDFFGKVRSAVFELHDYNCDTQKCREILKEMRFLNCETLRQEPGKFSLEFYSR